MTGRMQCRKLLINLSILLISLACSGTAVAEAETGDGRAVQGETAAHQEVASKSSGGGFALTAKEINELADRACKLTDIPAGNGPSALLKDLRYGVSDLKESIPDWQRQEDFLQWFFVGAALLGVVIVFLVWRTTPSPKNSSLKVDGQDVRAATTGDDK